MRHCRLESRMRENRLSGLEGGGADIRSPYPYPSVILMRLPFWTVFLPFPKPILALILREIWNL
jgi:hypothetical protein